MYTLNNAIRGMTNAIDWSKVSDTDREQYRRGLLWVFEVAVKNPKSVSWYWLTKARVMNRVFKAGLLHA